VDNLTCLKFLAKTINGALTLFFPEKCLNCGKKGKIICQKCVEKLPCPANTADLWAAASYRDKTIKRLIWQLKYRNVKSAASVAAELILLKTPITKFIGQTNCLLVPIPLSRKKLKKRGYNQAELIAKFISDSLKIKTETGALYKKTHTASQVEAGDRKKRVQNIKGSFSVPNPEIVKGKIIFVIDDVTTTGATIEEARRVLSEAGAEKIIGVVTAK